MKHILFLVFHRPLADPPWMKLLTLPRLGYSNAAVGKEVGFSLVRKSPFSSWTRGASITPTGAKEHQCSLSTFFRVLFDEVSTLAATEGEPDGSNA